MPVRPFYELELFYDDVPPSLNRIGSRGSHWAFNDAKERWQTISERLLMVARLPRESARRVRVDAVLRFPTNRERDEGNFRSLLEKSFGDALVNGRWLPVDTAERYRFGHLTFDPQLGPKRTLLHVRWWPR
jgi:hypothetical protein